MSKPGVQVRVQAARALLKVINDHHSLDDILPDYNMVLSSSRDQALMNALCYGVMRWYEKLNCWLKILSSRPLEKLQREVHVLLLLGLYQLKFTRIPEHAAIDTTVDSTRHLKISRAKGVINAILRNFLRQQSRLEKQVDDDPVCRYAHPEWLLRQLQHDWPDDWEAIADANTIQAPMILRIDASRMTARQYLDQLTDLGLSAASHPYAKNALVLQEPVAVDVLPGFSSGLVSVQDAAAQLAVDLLDIKSSCRVLDACAAPGGKTAQILQETVSSPVQVDALDINRKRLQKLENLFTRIGKTARTLQGDAAKPDTWWDGKPYDRILLDAPCSASGVIRRHPDIMHHRRPKAVQNIIHRQASILDAMWKILSPGGILVYATCSVFKDENENQINRFLLRHTSAALMPFDLGWGRGDIGRQILTGESNMDGFYFARLIKT
ncbi:MAG: 16S rRNA (cytosine(967)-C(5))-methyltransferase RsmB [Gammaproteobacteria bacterium]|nr:MAG: 16S rRNA (cytosine(967)-C(5))-methyltransferase RsmB [Gammaproteobacteria bacterium]